MTDKNKDNSSFESNFAWAKTSNLYNQPVETASRLAAEIRHNQLNKSNENGKRNRNGTSSTSSSSSSTSFSSSTSSSSNFNQHKNKTKDSKMTNVILVHSRQRKNPVLSHIKYVKKEFHDNLPADYVVGAAVGILWLSVKYHLLHPNYIRRRFAELRGHYQLSILLLMVDEDRPATTIEKLTLLCVKESITMVCCWSNEEGARYLETFKVYEKKSAKMIQANLEGNYASQLNEFLTSIRSVTKRDVLTLITTFGTLKNIMSCSMLQLSLCPGLGPTKCQNIYEAFNGPLAESVIPMNDKRAPVRRNHGDGGSAAAVNSSSSSSSSSSSNNNSTSSNSSSSSSNNSSNSSSSNNNYGYTDDYSGYSGDNP